MKKITTLFILIGILIVSGYDIYAIAKGGTEASISSTIIVWSYRFPAFTFLSGFVAGHLFWRMKANTDTKESIDK